MSLYTRIIDLQKLQTAWSKVKKNKPAAGADNITVEEFEADIKTQLRQLNIELEEHRYEVFPVKLVSIKREEKVREVSLYAMRDKVVQASIASELYKLLDGKFSSCACAYRNDSSALQVVGTIEEKIAGGQYYYFLKTDIRGFFDNISLEKLEGMLKYELREEDVVELIMRQLRVQSVSSYGDLTEKSRGIYQGSGISPILSNLYLNGLDHEMEKEPVYYVRYADDILILAESYDAVQHARTKLAAVLTDLDLELNLAKTYSKLITGGFDFLGYHFDEAGKSVPVKAHEKLETSLEDVWLTLTGVGIEDRLKKCSQILNGWQQYYRGDTEIENIYVYVTLVYMMRDREELKEMARRRPEFVNNYKDIAVYLIGIWRDEERKDLELLEYEQLFDIAVDILKDPSETYMNEIIGLYGNLIRGETEQDWASVMQAYSDIGEYDRAQRAMEREENVRDRPQIVTPANVVRKSDTDVKYNTATVQFMMDLLAGREDMYTREKLDIDSKRISEFVPEPFTAEVLRAHLDGKETVGTYLVRSNDTVHYCVIDVDVSRKAIIAAGDNEALFNEHLQRAAESALKIQYVIAGMGMKTYIEFSGYRGYHVWLFFTDWIQIRFIYSLFEVIKEMIGELPEDVTAEYFPMKSKKKAGRAGQNIKLPYGIHVTSGKRSYFCEEDLTPVDSLNAFFSSIAKYSAANLKKVIGNNISDVHGMQSSGKEKVQLDYSMLRSQSDSVLTVLKGCNLMQYLVNKSMTTGYLSHFERLSVLHVFGHLGEDGKEFVHEVMSYTINYQYGVTQRFIVKMPAKPVSCLKLRDQYKQVTAAYGCSCVFKRAKDCYPSPVIHALKDNSEDKRDITIPTSRTISQTKKDKVYEELNVHNRVQELADKLLELKKQKRGIEKSVQKVERELCTVFDSSNIDCAEIEMGMLSRRKTENGYEWTIEI